MRRRVDDSATTAEGWGTTTQRKLTDAAAVAESNLFSLVRYARDSVTTLEAIAGFTFVKKVRDSVAIGETVSTSGNKNGYPVDAAVLADSSWYGVVRKVVDATSPSDTVFLELNLGSASVLGGTALGDFALGV